MLSIIRFGTVALLLGTAVSLSHSTRKNPADETNRWAPDPHKVLQANAVMQHKAYRIRAPPVLRLNYLVSTGFDMGTVVTIGGPSEPQELEYGPFFVRVFIILAFVLMIVALYGKYYLFLEERFGLKLAYACCACYACMSITIDLSIANAARVNGGKYAFSPVCAVVCVEFFKLVFSTVLFGMSVSQQTEGQITVYPNAKDIGWLCVPALVYAGNNVIVFSAIANSPLSAFGVIRETMLIWNALLWVAVFGVSLSMKRWLSIIGIIVGVVFNQIPHLFNADFTWGIMWAFLLAFTNAAGAVANEFAMKRKAAMDINLQNSILYSFCFLFALLYIVMTHASLLSGASTFFAGFKPACLQVILCQVLTGLVVSRILKYADAVTKTIVAALRGPGVIFIGALIFHTKLTMSDVIATLVVCTCCFIYLREGPLYTPPAAATKT